MGLSGYSKVRLMWHLIRTTIGCIAFFLVYYDLEKRGALDFPRLHKFLIINFNFFLVLTRHFVRFKIWSSGSLQCSAIASEILLVSPACVGILMIIRLSSHWFFISLGSRVTLYFFDIAKLSHKLKRLWHRLDQLRTCIFVCMSTSDLGLDW